MKFALLITASPFSTQGPQTALRFARAALSNGHTIERVFFFRDGVHTASHYAVSPQDECNIQSEWQSFCTNNAIDSVVCVSAALKRGIVDVREAQRHQYSSSNLSPTMSIGGLGMLTEAIINADRVISFG